MYLICIRNILHMKGLNLISEEEYIYTLYDGEILKKKEKRWVHFFPECEKVNTCKTDKTFFVVGKD